MAVTYSIKAEVVDIRSDSPINADVFFVDTNVWYWMTYPKATAHVSSLLSDYPGFINRALTAGAQMHHSGLSLAELAHIIEKTEREIHEKLSGAVKPKEYRHNMENERARVVSEIQAAWGQVESLASPLSLTIDTPTTAAALGRLHAEKVDGYDLFILESMKNHKVIQVITDDGDFVSVPGIQVFTANRNVINAALRQGKLVAR